MIVGILRLELENGSLAGAPRALFGTHRVAEPLALGQDDFLVCCKVLRLILDAGFFEREGGKQQTQQEKGRQERQQEKGGDITAKMLSKKKGTTSLRASHGTLRKPRGLIPAPVMPISRARRCLQEEKGGR